MTAGGRAKRWRSSSGPGRPLRKNMPKSSWVYPRSTLKRSLDIFKLQTEHVSLSHLQLAQSMREEAKKLEDFREKQKDTKKKVEQHMEVLHKHKSSQLKRTMESKRSYEQKCKDKEEAEQNVNRGSSSTKHMDKLCAKAQQAKVNAEEADRIYRQNVTLLAKIRDDWLKEHIQACEVFEKQAADRIGFVRNTIWTHLNLLSQQCVSADELNEEVRKSLEKCDIQEDMEHFVKLRRTGEKPPAPVLYENFYSGQRVPPPQLPPPLLRACPSPRQPDNRRGMLGFFCTLALLMLLLDKWMPCCSRYSRLRHARCGLQCCPLLRGCTALYWETLHRGILGSSLAWKEEDCLWDELGQWR
ncbi:proline-serine-threonine phosphatase-interacting protein 2 isoform X2 [Dunckerocampus dactyliophorus]|uniref:proline-serine-threonine phosphatase-interacting protein 2 isoform X2 n=1 Tax=Dunckerocampus dactyliophorus TaxID=161453 RepID=UPI002406B3F0|nr:proline-serine-threonine phosphatase-interacting protein 2 isoform X2 [Dunckerocampus dactyliophorus]XP_054612317.1 proline-serine-threonine phosphatase-interacting protein 2 isoform X2 [Dunckerocampus dactyliophorus]